MAYSNSNDLGPAVLAVAWVFAGLSIAVVFARFYVRVHIINQLRLDDCIILITLFLGLGNSVFLTISSSWGLGKHVQTLAAEPQHIIYTIKWVYLCEFFSIMSAGFGRISFSFLLLSLTPPTKTRRRLLWSIIFIQFVVDVGTVIISFCQCRPIEGFWDKNVKAECWPPYVQQYTGFCQGSVSSMADFILALFPTSLFWNLNMEWKQKAFISSIMGLGIFAMVASIAKTIQLQALTQTDDLTYAMAKLAIWWTLEASIVLIAVSIPTMRPILKTPKTLTRKRLRHGANFDACHSLERIPGYNTENRRFCELFQDPTLNNETSADYLRTESTSSCQLNNSVHPGFPYNDRGRIRKDVTVLVTFGKPERD